MWNTHISWFLRENFPHFLAFFSFVFFSCTLLQGSVLGQSSVKLIISVLYFLNFIFQFQNSPMVLSYSFQFSADFFFFFLDACCPFPHSILSICVVVKLLVCYSAIWLFVDLPVLTVLSLNFQSYFLAPLHVLWFLIYARYYVLK